MAVTDPPVRAHGGVEGFGITFSGPTKISTVGAGIRINTDPPLKKIKMVEIILEGGRRQQIQVAGEWQVLFHP
jgi:hypothetical protein